MATTAVVPLAGSSAPAGLRCELITDFRRLEALAPEWERLFAAVAPAGGMFQSWGWARAYWTVHGEELSLCTPVVFDGPDLIGILPVAVRGRTARLLGDPYADYNGLLCAPERTGQVLPLALNALLDAPADWTRCVFDGVRAGTPLLHDGPELPAWWRRRRQVTFAYSCPTVVNDGTVFRQFSRKHSLRNKESQLKRLGRLSIRDVEDRDEILTRHLDRFFEMHVTRQALSGVRSLFLAAEARAMVRALVTELDPARDLRFSVLEVDDHALAYHLGFQHGRKFALYMTTFDLDAWTRSPGGVLLRKAFEWAHERQLEEFDFTIGDEDYKSHFANRVAETFTVHFDRHPRSPGTAARRVARRTRERIRRNPDQANRMRRARTALIEATRRARHPVALLRSGCRGAWPGVSSTEHRMLCRPIDAVAAATGAQVRRLTLKTFALLRLQYASLDHEAVEAGRRAIVRGDAAYLVSVDSFDYLFWVAPAALTPTTSGEAAAPVSEIREGVMLGGSPVRKVAGALTALLATLRPGGDVWILSKHPGAVRDAARAAGYQVLSDERVDASACNAAPAETRPGLDGSE